MTQKMLIRWLEAWRDELVRKHASSQRVDEVMEMIQSQRGSLTFPGWPFDLDEQDTQ